MHLRSRIFLALIVLLVAIPIFAQQTGSISGKVTATDGSALPGVTVEARSNVLPQPRVTTSDSNGDYRLPALIPGSYTLTFSLSGMQTATRKAEVNLGQNTAANVNLGIQGVAESITVTARSTLVDKTSTELQSGVSQQQIQALPLTQNYGDLQKLVPGVMYTQDTVRGPSAGASGQENTYRFDGANITMPLFGVLSAQPNTNDIAQVNITRGGANAIDFNRAGGFQLDTVSKSGTNKFSGQLGYQFQNPGFIASQTGVQNLFYQRKNTWSTVNLGGPVLPDRLYFYASYYRPFATRENTSNLYGTLPQYKDTRNEEFGKLTFTPTQTWLLNASYRNSKEVQTTSTFGSLAAPTVGTGYQTSIKLGNLEGSKIINDKSFATFKFTSFKNPGGGRADNFVSGGVNPSTALGTQLDLANLGTIGSLSVPLPIAGNTAQNAFIAPYIAKYGYMCPQDAQARGLSCTPGQMAGGGLVGYGSLAADNDSFFRHGGQAAYNYTLGSKITHDLHVGFEKYVEGEDLYRTSNGWGALSIPAGVGAAGTCPASACGSATPAFFVASYSPQGTGQTPIIHSEFHTQSAEFNDVIRWQNWSFNFGVLASDDVLYGQGLAKADNIAGFVKSPGTKYRMHEFQWKDQIQPRLGTTWAYNGNDTIFASFARYNPPANSDARAASWDRNLVQTVNSYFDANGKLIGVDPVASSSGKWWQAGIKPPEYKEIMLGTARQLTSGWSAKLYGRARKGDHYIEDTNNNARIAYNPPPGVPQQLYIPNLGTVATPGTIRNAIGSGSSYVIANLDGAFTKYLEATAESDYRGSKGTLHGSYTWSHYYGNFDQDYTSVSTDNDAARFIGSSNIGDGAGRQLWDMKYGDLRGDRRHVVKLYGTYYFPWQGTAGAFFVFQSGQPYQLESVLPYRPLTGSTSDTDRYAEPAGSRRTPSQSDLDLNYTQSLPIVRGFRLQLAFDVFNVMNRQTGYNYEERIGTLGIVKVANTSNPYAGPTVPIPGSISDATLEKQLGNPANYNRADYAVVAPHPNSYLAPRRFQITARIQF